jgi:hypothetical protein
MTIAPGATETILLRLSDRLYEDPFADAKQVLALRPAEADAFLQHPVRRGGHD